VRRRQREATTTCNRGDDRGDESRGNDRGDNNNDDNNTTNNNIRRGEDGRVDDDTTD
jgi:hypothetical protein